MVQLYARLTVAPDRIQEITQALRAVMLPARLHRDCPGARICSDTENPTILYYSEDWLTTARLDQEIHSPRFTRLMEVMESSTNAPLLEFRFFSQVHGLEYAEAKRNL
jgi:quinol monooxygenase YgiN